LTKTIGTASGRPDHDITLACPQQRTRTVHHDAGDDLTIVDTAPVETTFPPSAGLPRFSGEDSAVLLVGCVAAGAVLVCRLLAAPAVTTVLASTLAVLSVLTMRAAWLPGKWPDAPALVADNRHSVVPRLRTVAGTLAALSLAQVVGAATGDWQLTAPLIAGALAWGLACGAREREWPRRVVRFCSQPELERTGSALETGEVDFVLDVVTDAGDTGVGVDVMKACHAVAPDLVVLGATSMRDADLAEKVAAMFATGIKVRTVNEFIEEFGHRVPVSDLSARWFLHDVMAVHVRWYRRSRTVFDVVVALLGCVLFALVLPFVALAIRLDSPGPVFFRQLRVGRYGRPFVLVKLRTMRLDAEADGASFAMRCDPRVTRVGGWLRRSRLDELPQLLNVLRGEMSIIGPRPEQPEFVKAAIASIPYFEFRHIVRPGITGWAQVTDGYASDLAGTRSKLERDLFYLKKQSIRFDLKILAMSVGCVLSLAGR
jgi:lipopolysaccharide/colanic/teichoic acid biosynthesis glycosyltransferase